MKRKRWKLSARIDLGFAALAGLLALTGVAALVSATRVAGDSRRVARAVDRARAELAAAAAGTERLGTGLQALRAGEARFRRLGRLVEGTAGGREAAAQLDVQLGAVEGNLDRQSENLLAAEAAVTGLAETLGREVDDAVALAAAAADIRIRVLEAYVGCSNYLNEHAGDVTAPLADIDAAAQRLETVAELAARRSGRVVPDRAVERLRGALQRFRRYVEELGRTTSTTQIGELQPALARYGAKAAEEARSLQEGAGRAADALRAAAVAVAQEAEHSVQRTVGANRSAVTVVRTSLQLAREAGATLRDAQEGFAQAAAAVGRLVAELPDAVAGAAESAESLRACVEAVEGGLGEASLSATRTEVFQGAVGAACAAAVLLGLALALWAHRKISVPLSRLTGGLHRAAANDLSVEIDTSGTRGELRELMEGVNRLVATFRASVEGLRRLSDGVLEGARELDRITAQTSAALDAQRDRASEVSAATEELTAATHEIAASSREADLHVRQVEEMVTGGTEAIGEMAALSGQIASRLQGAVNTVTELEEDSQEIDSIVEIIEEIADQTGLLALNAAIEAARAGEHGRGFAVVADEVRKLAEKTARSTRGITDVVQGVRQKIGSTVAEMRDCGAKSADERTRSAAAAEQLQRIGASIGALARQVAGIATATREQETAFPTISDSLDTIHAVTRDTARKMEEVNRRVQELVQLSQDLQTRTAVFVLDASERSSIATRG